MAFNLLPAPPAGASLPVGYIDASDYGVNPAKYALWNPRTNGHSSMALADSTADFQAVFDAVAALRVSQLASQGGGGGTTIMFPKGRYLMTGTVTIPDMPGIGGLVVDMTNVEILHKPQTTGVSMFRTAKPTSNTDAEAKNDIRDRWTWRGGFYDGDRNTQSTGFEWNATSRMVMERVFVTAFDTGIRGRFVLHFNLRDSTIQSCTDYGVHIEAAGSGDWTGCTAGNAASNGTLIQNVRFYGHSTNIAQLRVAHSGHIVRDCTFEGVSPAGHNYQFSNGNTSCLTSRIENLWIENDAALGHIMVDTMHQFEVDIQYTNTDSVVIDARQCGLLKVVRMPWPGLTSSSSLPIFACARKDGNGSGVKMAFELSGPLGRANFALPNLWEDRISPSGLFATSMGDGDSGPVTWFSGNGRRVWRSAPPFNPPTVLNGVNTDAWVLAFLPVSPLNTVAPAISGTTTVGSTLTCSDGTWTGTPAPKITKQWKRDGVNITGATGNTYVLVTADLGTTITCTVSGFNVFNNGTTATATATGVGPIT